MNKLLMLSLLTGCVVAVVPDVPDIPTPMVVEQVEGQEALPTHVVPWFEVALQKMDTVTSFLDPVFVTPLHQLPVLRQIYPDYKGIIKPIMCCIGVWLIIRSSWCQAAKQKLGEWYRRGSCNDHGFFGQRSVCRHPCLVCDGQRIDEVL